MIAGARVHGRVSYAIYMWLAFEALISVFGSARHVEARARPSPRLDDRRSVVAERFGEDASMVLPAEPMRRHPHAYGRDRYLADPDLLERLIQLHRDVAARQARAMGLLDPEGPGPWARPDLSRVFYADDKVISPLFTTKRRQRVSTRRPGRSGRSVPNRMPACTSTI